jgi:hypothetical protein
LETTSKSLANKIPPASLTERAKSPGAPAAPVGVPKAVPKKPDPLWAGYQPSKATTYRIPVPKAAEPKAPVRTSAAEVRSKMDEVVRENPALGISRKAARSAARLAVLVEKTAAEQAALAERRAAVLPKTETEEEDYDREELEAAELRAQQAWLRRLEEEEEAERFCSGGAASSSKAPAPSDRPQSPVRRRPRDDEEEVRGNEPSDYEVGSWEISVLEAQHRELALSLQRASEAQNWNDVVAIGAQLNAIDSKINKKKATAAVSRSQPTGGKKGPSAKGSTKGYQSGKPGTEKYRRM